MRNISIEWLDGTGPLNMPLDQFRAENSEDENLLRAADLALEGETVTIMDGVLPLLVISMAEEVAA